ncbi:universal stress protein [Aureispira anguillae]|uniref:Universal stress protein n=1 Tax=Aureispira anguillae TaxID=2864201 RepID=A0A916DWR1_9BACT|nr:universal stress protein [Aureispira anguillae]BDS14965.1 universal stress protein [Aureispira anguillae]
MKNILLPTDFSKNAEKALDLALALARKFDAALHIIHTYHVTSHAGHLANVSRVIKEDREKEMQEFIESIKANLTTEVEVTGRCRKGYPVEVIEAEANKVSADLIIMGTLGASNLGKKLMGSTASNLIKNTKFPVLAVPKDTHYSDLNNVVVAIDALTMTVMDTLNPMIDIAQQSKLDIDLVHVSSQQLHTDIDPTIKEYLNKLAINHSYTKIQSDDLLNSILDFAHEKGNSILCLVSRQRNWFENLFHSSISQQIALKSDLPLLVLQEEDSAS